MSYRSLLSLLWIASTLSLSTAYSQSVPDVSSSLRAGADSAHLVALMGMRGAVNVDPARLDQYFDAAAMRRALSAQPPSASVTRTRRHRHAARKAGVIPTKKPLSHRSLIIRVPPVPPASDQYAFKLLQSKPEATDRYDDLIMKYANVYHVDPRLMKSVIAAESEFNPRALSWARARGLMQLLPNTAEEMGVSHHQLADPESNIRAGAAYINLLFRYAWRTFHMPGTDFRGAPLWLVQRVIAAYHAGPKFLSGTWWCRATKEYIRKVVLFYRSNITDLRRLPEYRTPGPKFSTIFSPEFIRY